MLYDLRDKESRKKFLRYANSLMRNQRSSVRLIDESDRTLNQNSYLHVLCRILAVETGVTEAYAKEVYLKELANPGLFIHTTKDTLSGKMVRYTRSTAELNIEEMSKAIYSLRNWAAENGYYLPDATIGDDGSVTFNSKEDAEAFRAGERKASELDQYIT